jgi:hypothetical protein
MPPRKLSRYAFCSGIKDADDVLFLTDRIPFPFRVLKDTRRYTVQQGDTLFSIAGKLFAPITRGAGLWWVIADFQPQPILDPTLQLSPGSTVFVPSVRTVHELVFSSSRRRESEL